MSIERIVGENIDKHFKASGLKNPRYVRVQSLKDIEVIGNIYENNDLI